MLVLLILLESLVTFLKGSHSASKEVWSEDTESAHLLPRGIEISYPVRETQTGMDAEGDAIEHFQPWATESYDALALLTLNQVSCSTASSRLVCI